MFEDLKKPMSDKEFNFHRTALPIAFLFVALLFACIIQIVFLQDQPVLRGILTILCMYAGYKLGQLTGNLLDYLRAKEKENNGK